MHLDDMHAVDSAVQQAVVECSGRHVVCARSATSRQPGRFYALWNPFCFPSPYTVAARHTQPARLHVVYHSPKGSSRLGACRGPSVRVCVPKRWMGSLASSTR
jgi:hypothetical protein